VEQDVVRQTYLVDPTSGERSAVPAGAAGSAADSGKPAAQPTMPPAPATGGTP
jgi:hypothetical protein